MKRTLLAVLYSVPLILAVKFWDWAITRSTASDDAWMLLVSLVAWITVLFAADFYAARPRA